MATDRLSPYLRRAVDAARERALAIHADELAREHLMERLFADEDSALSRAVLDAFADPEGMAVESLALSPGILVVGSGEATPFSTRAVDAIRRARARAIDRGAREVTPRDVLEGCVPELADEARDALTAAGLREDARDDAAGGDSPIRAEGHLFHAFSNDARRMLVAAAREAHRAEEPSISPARLLLAALAADRALGEATGLTGHRARMVLDGRTVDDTPPPPRAVPDDPAFTAFLDALPRDAGSLEVALAVLTDPKDELAQVLLRQKVGPERLDAARAAFQDPD